MTTLTRPEIGAEEYAYLLPDHWIMQRDGLFAAMHHAYVGRVVEIVRQSGARTVLEAGCGDGWNCGRLAAAGLDVVGVDWSANGIEHARRLVRGARFFCGDLRDKAFRANFPDDFDAVVFVEVLEHIPPEDCAGAMRNLASVLKPGGVLVLTTPSVNFPNSNPQHYRHFTEELIREIVAEAGGLEVVSVEGYGHVLLENRHWRLRRGVDNRFWTIKPAVSYLLRRYAARCSGTPMDVCHGLIVTMRAVGPGAGPGAPIGEVVVPGTRTMQLIR